MARIPVVDLFAGPGGLGEGFSTYTDHNGQDVFDIFLSIEKDIYAHSTLELRSFFRKIADKSGSDAYYEYLRKKSLTRSTKQHKKLRHDLFAQFPCEAELAQQEAWCAELGKYPELNKKIDARISEVVGRKDIECWGIIGGPPCQAYSVIGRSRNKGKIGYTPESDKRTYLYQQYLRIIARHKPDFFIMENVKGVLSAQLNGKSLFQKILGDLRHPGRNVISSKHKTADLEYQIYPLAADASIPEKSTDFIIPAELYGIPQARHRVVLLGVKKDFSKKNLPG
jgi:DNA (cytosine-5)-methyltransferase 1